MLTNLLIFGLLAPTVFSIIWLSNSLTMSVHDEGYSGNTSCALNYISTCSFKNQHDFGHTIIYVISSAPNFGKTTYALCEKTKYRYTRRHTFFN